ncbi:methylated-DNA--[protein]-cysteine S-methyltransferase [Streptomyces prasinopilosus]|uniref:methylated-DNA--[protein]-cysteine S-methyltransferase n=1 Tax=Streptomyces prasinopilosus TaxID=67344 RepID=A0A1G6LAI7_9ACTN|nr:methylated-DNA--[protein]-cysteine S-methyltransferase [Streptomyces prasinopilosus]SDC40432.1 methylated-DNA-[protein]-cysteine S-methyltransferase [Streptomyces prasinopilosus]
MSTPPTAALAPHRTTLGPLTLAATDDALVLCAFDDREQALARLGRGGLTAVDADAATADQRRILEEAGRQLDAYLEGRSRAFTVRMDLRLATPFSRTTVERLDGLLPYGATGTYAELAAALGRPRAARAVGTALGANPLCVVLPCHRVVGSGGRLTGYAGGVAAKRFLLDLESGRTSPASL